MSALNNTIQVLISETIGCSAEPNELFIRALVLVGIITIIMSLFSKTSMIFEFFAYIYGFFKWIWNKFRGKTI